jgi:Mitochondrial carrier protein
LLYPIDTIKTMQQSDKSVKGFKSAITKLQNGHGGIMKLYSGFWAAVLGSIPSSAIYFGSYETSKRVLFNNYKDRISRPVIHMLAAASGNIMSSFVFVPKDAIKQQMQAIKTGSVPWVKMSPFYSNSMKARSSSSVSLPDVIRSILKKKGLKGFYPNYRATLMRNIPSAVVSRKSLKLFTIDISVTLQNDDLQIRFTVYEELRLLVQKSQVGNNDKRLENLGVRLTLSSHLIYVMLFCDS